MFWDTVAGLYDVFENLYNGKANRDFCAYVSSLITGEDEVLECACGTGMISAYVAPRCRHLTATDFSRAMLREAQKKCSLLCNVEFCEGNIMSLAYEDNSFDKVIAGNVVHLLDEPYEALHELLRVCRPGGKMIIPTYVNASADGRENAAARLLSRLGAGFKCQFDFESYKKFFEDGGFTGGTFSLFPGRMPCAVAVFTKGQSV